MSRSDELALAARIEAVVRAVPGVTAVFRPGGTVATVVDTGARLLGIRDEDAALVRLEATSDGPRVTVAIGVRASAGAVATAHRAEAAIRTLLAEQSVTVAAVELSVVHIAER